MPSSSEFKPLRPTAPAAVQPIVDALRRKGWLLEIECPQSDGDDTIITARGLPRLYISISEDEVVTLNIDEEGIGGDTTIRSLALSHTSSEREEQIQEISNWFG